jgi:hypothetical protein
MRSPPAICEDKAEHVAGFLRRAWKGVESEVSECLAPFLTERTKKASQGNRCPERLNGGTFRERIAMIPSRRLRLGYWIYYDKAGWILFMPIKTPKAIFVKGNPLA